LTLLERLDISHNNIKAMDSDVFDSNVALKSLSIAGNEGLNISLLATTLCHMTTVNKQLRKLSLFLLNIRSGDWKKILLCLEKMHLIFLDISHNPVGYLETFTFSKMTSLEVLYLKAIIPINIQALVNLTNLKLLVLSDCILTEIPSFYDPLTRKTILPRLESVILGYNNIHYLPNSSVGLDNVKSLILGKNDINHVNGLSLFKFVPRLKYLILDNNLVRTFEQLSFIHSLDTLSLNNCGLQFTRHTGDIFGHLKSLYELALSHNSFARNEINVENPFNCLSSLCILYLEDCSLKRIHDGTFQGLVHLTKLSLKDNSLSSLSSEIFKHLPSLKTLNLVQNRLTVIRESSLISVLPTLQQLNVARNPFICNCDLLWFMELFRSTKIRIGLKTETDAYRCYGPPNLHNVRLSSFNITSEDCTHVPLWVTLSISLGSSLTVIIPLLAALVYRYRWHIGYIYFLLRARRREAREIQDDTQYVYDAFVVYNRTDVSWVKDQLLPAMQEKADLTLCVHDRDWLLGRDIVDNIVQSIESSRKILLVVSNAFAISQWCQLELTMAQHRLLEEDRNALILVLLEPLKRENITPRLLLQMKRQTYIEWTEDPIGQNLFWKKLHRALQKRAGSVVHGSYVRTQNVSNES
jgi:Leucine-rich repeat (LRR) protein